MHDPFSRPDPLLSLGSGQIQGCLWRGWAESTRNGLLAKMKIKTCKRAMPRRLYQRSHNYLGALRWLFSQDLPLLTSGLNYQSASAICHRLDQQIFSDDHIPRLGLECDLSRSKIDLAFSGGPELFANCQDLTLNDFGTRLIALRDNSLARYLPPFYFIEYDSSALGYVLAGGFAKVNSIGLNWNESCDLINSILTKYGYNSLDFSGVDHEILKALQIIQRPTQLGFMSGRGDIIKIMGEISRNHKQVASAINRMQNKCGLASDIDAGVLSKILSQSRVNGTVYSISYDYDLSRHTILPRLSVEIMPMMWNRHCPMAEKWSHIESIISLFKLDEVQMKSAQTFSTQLPFPNLNMSSRSSILNSDDTMDAQDCEYGILPHHLKLSINRHQSSIKAYCSVEQTY